ncbi:MAG: TAXI family TRAP transporter solute-binding subunit [Dehalobacterium sp.]
MKKNIMWGILLLLVIFCLLISACGTAEKSSENNVSEQNKLTEITISAASVGGTWDVTSQLMKQLIEENMPDTRVTVTRGGGVSNVVGVSEGQFDFAWTYTPTLYQGIKGEAPFDKAYTNVVGFANTYMCEWNAAVLANSDIKSINDLKGKRISPGVAGYSGEQMCKEVLEVYGLTYDDMSKVEFLDYGDSTTLMKDREIDFMCPAAVTPVPAMAEIDSTNPISLIPLDQDKLEELKKINPGYAGKVVPKGTYKGLTEDTLQLAFGNILVVRKDLDENLVYNVLKVMWENRNKLLTVHQAYSQFTEELAPQIYGAELHPGAKKFFKEIGAIK